MHNLSHKFEICGDKINIRNHTACFNLMLQEQQYVLFAVISVRRMLKQSTMEKAKQITRSIRFYCKRSLLLHWCIKNRFLITLLLRQLNSNPILRCGVFVPTPNCEKRDLKKDILRPEIKYSRWPRVLIFFNHRIPPTP